MSEATAEAALAGQLAVVTGGGRGIGREVARQLAGAGAEVVVTARTLAQLEETQKLIQKEGGKCHAYQMDVLNEEEIVSTFDQIEKAIGGVDLLVNNAGISGAKGHPWELSTEDWWRVMEINLRGPYVCSKAVIPGMIERKKGRIIMMGSNIAFFPFPTASAYSASKAGLVRLGDNLAVALKEHGISVFTISPGLVRTDMTKDIPDDVFKDAEWTPIEKPGQLCVILASGVADVLTGRFIHASMHDIHALIANGEEIVKNDLQTMRLVDQGPEARG